MSLRLRTLPAGFIEPCLPTSAKHPPSGRRLAARDQARRLPLIARKDGKRVRLYSRPGNDLTRRFTRIVEAVARLKARTCIIDGEAVVCGPDGIAFFDLIRHRRHDERVFLRAFDIIEINGDDLRREPLISRKVTPAIALAGAAAASSSTSTLSMTTARSCSSTPASSASKASSRSVRIRAMAPGRSHDWMKLKNPSCAAVTRRPRRRSGGIEFLPPAAALGLVGPFRWLSRPSAPRRWPWRRDREARPDRRCAIHKREAVNRTALSPSAAR